MDLNNMAGSSRVRVLDRPESIYHTTKKTQESSIRQEWDIIPLPKVQQLVSSVPDVYRCG